MTAGALAWDGVDEARRNRVLAVLRKASTARALADRDLYASNATDAPAVDVLRTRVDGEQLTVEYLFSWWEWCPAQSGSDWNYHCVYRGTAVFAGHRLKGNDIEPVCRNYVHESSEETYDRAAVLEEVRTRLAGAAG